MKRLRMATGISVLVGALALALAASVVGCSSSADVSSEAQLGTVSMQLTGQTNGNSYRLRNARFDVAGPTQTVLDSETDLTLTTLNATLPTGDYTITLEPGWSLEKLAGGTFQVVDAALTSPNPKSFQILGGGTSNVAYQFSTNGTLVTIGTGQLSLSIGVTENGGAGSGSACSLITRTGCLSPELCYFVQKPDGSSAGQCFPPGTVPIGATCTGSSDNECASAGICATTSATAPGTCFLTCGPANPCPVGQACGSTGLPDLNVCQ